jgi:predicted nucleic acid-binding protein
LAEKKAVYWDSCVWITLINGDPGADRCQSVLEAAQAGELTIWTSSLALAEVYKFKCDGPKELALADDALFEEYIASEFVIEVQVDHDIAVMSRRLCRKYAPLKKPNDGVHLASAIISNVDEFHTFDKEDLLVLAGKILRSDGQVLKICEPPVAGFGRTAALGLAPPSPA